MTTYTVQKIAPPTSTGKTWRISAELSDGSKVLIGFHPTRKAAVLCARLLAGWRGKVVVNKTPERITAWRVDAA